MDATNRYVMMCQKAEEIQNLWVPKQCDFIINHEDLEEGVSFCSPAESFVRVVNMYYEEQDSKEYLQECDDLKEQALWLPRQDQLQKITETDNTIIYSIMSKVIGSQYYDYTKNASVAASELFYSMEQLWLGYVMREKFKKAWNEQDWISVGKQEN
jgi:hypothetical protein